MAMAQQIAISLEMNSEFDGEVFFPKPSNEEQRRIVDKIRAASGVLVQGPPGTGKSHTIANLICHLLATGQRTLITAKTPRALQVLERLVPAELRPLCINLLGSGLEERRSLESSVGGILRKNEEWNEDRAKHERETLEGQLRQLREEKAKVDRRLRDIRESETHSQSIAEGTYRGTAARIAEAVNRNRNTYEWFTDAVPVDKTCPISESDLRSVLSALRYFTPEKRQRITALNGQKLCHPQNGWPTFLRTRQERLRKKAAWQAGLMNAIADLLTKSDPATIEAIRDALCTFRDTRRKLMELPYSWMADRMRDAMSGNTSFWRELSRATRDSIASIETLVPMADDTSIDFPEGTSARALL